MSTATKSNKGSIAERWRQGTTTYLESFKPIAEEIHKKAGSMPHNNLDDAAKIVEMAVARIREHAESYHRDDGE